MFLFVFTKGFICWGQIPGKNENSEILSSLILSLISRLPVHSSTMQLEINFGDCWKSVFPFSWLICSVLFLFMYPYTVWWHVFTWGLITWFLQLNALNVALFSGYQEVRWSKRFFPVIAREWDWLLLSPKSISQQCCLAGEWVWLQSCWRSTISLVKRTSEVDDYKHLIGSSLTLFRDTSIFNNDSATYKNK